MQISHMPLISIVSFKRFITSWATIGENVWKVFGNVQKVFGSVWKMFGDVWKVANAKCRDLNTCWDMFGNFWKMFGKMFGDSDF